MKIKSVTKVKLSEPKQFYDVIECTPWHNFAIETNTGKVFSHNCGLSDEVNFAAGNLKNIETMKARQLNLISQVDARMKSRFLRGNYLPTLNIIISSKNSDQSFLDEYINTKKKLESTTTLIVDEPQWVVDSRKVTDEWFYVGIGNKFLASEVIPIESDEEVINSYREKGYQLLKVPAAYYEDFRINVDNALRDIAGLSTISGLKFISGARWNEIKTDSYENPFTQDILEVGNSPDDKLQYYDFFDLKKVPLRLKRKPLYIHLDMSMSGDKTGIAGVWGVGKRPKIEGESASREMYYQLAFGVSIKAPRGYQISFDKTRTFIRWLRKQGFNICGISMDTFQSAQMRQQLIADGFEAEVVSVDRLDPQAKQCLPYEYFKATIYDRRMIVFSKCDLLTEEILGLEKLSDGHIDHPEHGTQGSKDQSDAVCGAMWNASQHAEEFGYDYGESNDIALEFNSLLGLETIEDINEAFEQSFIERHQPNIQTDKDYRDEYLDFGYGPSVDDYMFGIDDGILFWG